MASGTVTKAARRAAREAAREAQDELRKRMQANTADLATYFSARERVEAVDEWFSERQATLVKQAAQRRSAQRLACGQALKSMRDRGVPVSEIARMAAIAEKTVRELVREAETGPEDAAGPAGAPQLTIVRSNAQSQAPVVAAVDPTESSRPAVSAQP
ncbi:MULTISPECIES: hypothetical protein [Mycobacterium]|uniref:hypothetical protein n=1 Tax=Mycobacterium TaxID=1763 RepID=UPI00197CE317|nr:MULTISPECIES: hypothetical protein [Mycobacterium]MDP7706896.1 hypothetical protein [Mycobacterium sp. TY815]